MQSARRLEYRVLGPLEVLSDGRSVRLGGPKPRVLLAVLLVHRNNVVSVARLVDALWGESPPPSAATMLHGYVSKLRKLLDDGNGRTLATSSGGYVLYVEPEQLDLARFERLVEASARASAIGSSSNGASMLREALSLWRGPPLADIGFEEALQDEIRRLDDMYLETVQRRIDADLAGGGRAELVPELEALARRHPLDERLHGQLMVALARSGRSADSLDVYRRLRKRLAEELGIEPDRELSELQASILRRESGLPQPFDAIEAPEVEGPKESRPARRGIVRAAVGSALVGAIAVGWLVSQRGADHPTRVPPNSVAMVDPRTNRVVGTIAVGEAPIGPVAGGRFVWTASATGRTLSRVTLEDGKATTTGIGIAPAGLAAAPGAVWVSAGDSPSVTRIDSRSGVVDWTRRIPNAPLGGTLVATPKALWLARRSELLRSLDPRTGRVLRAYAAVTNGDALAVDAGTVWVGTAGASVLARVDPGTGGVSWVPFSHSVRALATGFGSVWVVIDDDDHLWRVDPHTLAVAGTIPVGREPTAIAVDRMTQSVWVANAGSGTVSRVDPASGRVVATVVTGNRPSGLAVVNGLVWVAVRASPAASGRSARLRVLASIRTGASLGLTADSRAIWVIERREGRLARIDPSTDRVVARLWTGPAQEPVAGVDGIWVPSVDNGRLMLIDPTRNRFAGSVRGPYFAVATGAAGVWALTHELRTLDRIDPKRMAVAASVRVPAAPFGVAVGGGSVWVCGGDFEHPRAPGWIWRIDPGANRVVARIQIPRLARKLAFGFGSLWATLHGALLYRIDPATNRVVARIRTSKGGSFNQDNIAIGERMLWVTNLNNSVDAELVGVDPATNRAVARSPLPQGPTGVAEAFGSVWVAHFSGARVLRFASERDS